ncbi:MAG: putative addiction module antidote protein [Rothia sp. (in: high G+C Gram-positive bacteria)]|uniref:addiction module antidote protein n=1 Tax=Rothia sp. (in: high G+C Gram-positive bacteria) TaxID=1885016 RepID=UPI0026E091A0|nr:addiction module antidote protein [Rothia sp. (in: high G+C Gram-positive bacteria)]MDO5751058.1 putative addiction module antidote protein [Rothia sp. (in: high G+C Gram-positive bacteria)]
MTEVLNRWDVSDYLATDEDIIAYLNAALEDPDSRILQAALGDIAKARGMSRVANTADLNRESLYKALSTNGNPSWNTMRKIFDALGLQLEVRVAA